MREIWNEAADALSDDGVERIYDKQEPFTKADAAKAGYVELF